MKIFCDGFLGSPRLDHPEGVSVHPDGPGPSVYRFDTNGNGGVLVAALPGTVPDRLAFGPDGLLYIGCYEPSQILRVAPDSAVEVVAHDPTAHDLCHPTNIAFTGSSIIAANLGRWHLTWVPTDGIV